jgi:ABC-type antimicrobial peptide transport system permease subunit
VKRRVVALDPAITMRLGVFETGLRESLARERAMAWLAGGFGVLATLLATIGLYGVIAYATARRRHEIGIRRALGASRGDILRLILVEASITVAAGVALGMGSAHAAVGSAGALLFGLSPHDTTTFVAAACLLSVVAGIASAVPAVRALRVGPMTALRCD